MKLGDLRALVARYLLIDIERVRVDASPPNRIRVRIQGATPRQCEYIADCLSPDVPDNIDLLVEGTPAQPSRHQSAQAP